MDHIATQTLYEMVNKWIAQPWDGTRYSHIAEQLWDSIETCGLIDGPFGTTMTLLESCVVDSVEGINGGLLDKAQAVASLTTLLQNDDFVEGAKIIEVYIKKNPVCRISNLTRLHKSGKGLPFPEWNRRKTLLVSLSFVSWLVLYVVLVGSFGEDSIISGSEERFGS